MKTFRKLSSCQKILFIVGSLMIGAGVGNLMKGYNDRNKYRASLGELVSKTMNGHSKFYGVNERAKVRLELTQEETHFLVGYQLYEKRIQTKLSGIPSWVNLLIIVIGCYSLSYSLKTKQAEQDVAPDGE